MFTHTNVLHAYAQAGDAAQVDEWLLQMQEAGVTPTTVMYNVGLNCHAKRGNSAQAARLLEEMIKVGAEPDGKSYATVIDGFARNGDGRQALHWFEEMNRRGISLDEAAYTSVIDSFANAGDVKQAVELVLDTMTEVQDLRDASWVLFFVFFVCVCVSFSWGSRASLNSRPPNKQSGHRSHPSPFLCS